MEFTTAPRRGPPRYSVETVAPSPPSAAIKVCQGKRAHLTWQTLMAALGAVVNSTAPC